ncbi:MAG: hypothetical protein H6644_11755 [Caldilineaceae bacterium]|nr:hypothetical protein [Caldilineaceae bacterium]
MIAHAVMTALLLHLSNTPWFYPVTVLLLTLLAGMSVAHTVFTELGGVHLDRARRSLLTDTCVLHHATRNERAGITCTDR